MNDISDKDKVIELLKTGPKSVKDLQSATKYNSRSLFLKKIIRPLIENNYIYRDGNAKSPSTLIHLSDNAGSNRKIQFGITIIVIGVNERRSDEKVVPAAQQKIQMHRAHLNSENIKF